MYRTVSLSAIAGVHFTEVSGTYTFPKNSTQPLRVSVNEMSPSTVNGAFLYHHNSTYRSYLFEVVDLSGYLLASTQRNIPYDNYKIMTNTAFAKQSLTVVSGETDQITEGGYQVNQYHAVPIADFFSNTADRTYFMAVGAKLHMTVDFQVREVDDGYQYIQILVDNPDDCDNRNNLGDTNPGNPTLSSYLAAFGHKPGSKYTTYEKYTFPLTTAGDNCNAIDEAWNFSPYNNEYGKLYTQKFRTNCRGTDGTLLIPSNLLTLGIRFNAAGDNNDNWVAKDIVANLQAFDPTAPTIVSSDYILVNPGRHEKGNYFYISVAFSEPVTYSGSAPVLSTTWGDATYHAGLGSNVLTFKGTITADAGTRLKVQGLTAGTIKDGTNNFSGNISKTFSITVDAHVHSWGAPTYTWSSDNSQVTATRTCLHDSSHKETETVNTTSAVHVEPTCTVMGTTDYRATFTNTAFTTQTKSVQDIPALGHDWDTPTYSWTDDYSVVVGKHICKRNSNHKEDETVNTTSTVSTPATCTEMGYTTYTATFTNPAFTTQTKTVQDVAALGHNWGTPTYTWTDDNTSATAIATCQRDNSHSVSETVNTSSEQTLAPTCTETGTITYNAVFENTLFGNKSKEVEIPALGHQWEINCSLSDDYTSMTATAVCQRDDSHIETETTTDIESVVNKAPTCTETGETDYHAYFNNPLFSVQSIPVTTAPLGHLWGPPTYTWLDDNATVEATHVCQRNQEHEEFETAETEITETTPTCTEPGATTYTANFTKEGFSMQTKSVPIAAIGHDWDTPTYSWSDDNLTATAQRICHNDNNHVETETVDADVETIGASCSAPGTVIYTATFTNAAFTGQTKSVEVAALGHDWGTPTYTWDDDYSLVEATRTCRRDATHSQSAYSQTTSQTTPPTCTYEGATIYTANFNVEWCYTQIKIVEIPALGHLWDEPIYLWDGDHSMWAQHTCQRDGVKETETVDVVVETFGATCTEPGETVYTATFTIEGFTTQTWSEGIPALGHLWGEPLWTWTGCEAATATFTCQHDATHTATLNATINQDNYCTYTASVTLDDNPYSTTEIIYPTLSMGDNIVHLPQYSTIYYSFTAPADGWYVIQIPKDNQTYHHITILVYDSEEKVICKLQGGETYWVTFFSEEEEDLPVSITAVPSYNITVDSNIAHGSIAVNPEGEAPVGWNVFIWADDEDDGYDLGAVTVTDADGQSLQLENTDGGVYFVMPASDVSITATFAQPLPLTVNNSEKIDYCSWNINGLYFDVNEAAPGAIVEMWFKPRLGYEVQSVSIETAGGNVIDYSMELDYGYYFRVVFIMPDEAVTVTPVVGKANYPALQLGDNAIAQTDENGALYTFTPAEDGAYNLSFSNDGDYMIGDSYGEYINDTHILRGTGYTFELLAGQVYYVLCYSLSSDETLTITRLADITTYDIIVSEAVNCTVETNVAAAPKNYPVHITVTPMPGYQLLEGDVQMSYFDTDLMDYTELTSWDNECTYFRMPESTVYISAICTPIADGVATDINRLGNVKEGDVIYTLSGMRLDKINKKGIYIVNGKKKVVK